MSGAVGLPSSIDPFPSLAAMQAAHGELLARQDDGEQPTDEYLDIVEAFIQRGHATGVLLDVPGDRFAAQSLLNYWATTLYRSRREPPEALLARYDATLAPDLDDSLCPYVGLDAFREEKHELFFGRQRLIADWISTLKNSRLLAVIGPSGSGKSSLVLAGLIPTLRAGSPLLPGSQTWRYFPPMVPGSDPLAALASLLRPAGANVDEWIAHQVKGFQQNSNHLAELVSQSGDTPAVLVVDQFEEVFTLCDNIAVQRAFVDNLLTLIGVPHRRHTVILTMRSDFVNNVKAVPELHEIFEAASQLVTPLTAAELREAIEQPAARIGLKFDKGIVDGLVKDILGEPAGLPLLQFALLKLWEKREHNRISLDAYNALGGARNALARSADAFYNNELIPQDQDTAQRILLRLVRPGEGLEILSNRERRETLYQDNVASDRVEWVLDKLVKERLLRLTEGDTKADDQVEVAHEALVRNWPRLVAWLDDERFTLKRRLLFSRTVEEWAQHGRDSGALWRGEQLEDARRFGNLNTLETAFIRASLQAQNRAAIIRGWLVGLLALVSLIAVAFGVIAFRQAQEAQSKSTKAEEARQTAVALQGTAVTQRQTEASLRRVATSRFLSAESFLNINTNADLAALLAMQATRVDDTAEARDVLLRVLEAHPQLRVFLYAQTSPTTAVAFSPDGRILATGNSSGIVNLWDPASAARIGAPIITHSGAVISLAFSPREGTLAAASPSGIRLWNLRDAAHPRLVGSATPSQAGPLSGVVFISDGRTLASSSQDGTVVLWNVRNPARPLATSAPLPGDVGPLSSLTFSPHGSILAAGSQVGSSIVLWDVHSVARPRRLGAPVNATVGPVSSLAFGARGTILAVGARDGKIALLDVHDPSHPRSLGKPVAGNPSGTAGLAFSSKGSTFVSASQDGAITVWDARHASALRPLGPVLTGLAGGVKAVAFSPDGKTVAAGDQSGVIALWDISRVARLGTLLTTENGSVTGVAFSPHDTRLAVRTGAQIELWDSAGRTRLSTLPGNRTAATNSMAFSRDGATLALGNVEGSVALWDVRDPAHPRFLNRRDTESAGAVSSLAFGPNGMLAVGSLSGLITLWAAPDPVSPDLTPRSRLLKVHSEAVNSIAFSRDGTLLASASSDRSVGLWDVRDFENAHLSSSLLGHTAGVNSVAFSWNGRTLASASDDRTVVLWDIHDPGHVRRLGQPLPGYTTAVNDVTFASDGTLISGSQDGSITLWDVRDPAQPHSLGNPLIGPAGAVNSVTLSSDGNVLASGSSGQSVWLWDMSKGAWQSRACSVANRNLTSHEWATYVGGDPPSRPVCHVPSPENSIPSPTPTPIATYVPASPTVAPTRPLPSHTPRPTLPPNPTLVPTGTPTATSKSSPSATPRPSITSTPGHTQASSSPTPLRTSTPRLPSFTPTPTQRPSPSPRPTLVPTPRPTTLPSGFLSLLAGNGMPFNNRKTSTNGDGHPAKIAELNYPTGLAVDRHGNIYIADRNNQVIRRVAPDHTISTVAGKFNRGCNPNDPNIVNCFGGDDGPATNAFMDWPEAVAVGDDGILYIADSLNHCIRKVTPTTGNVVTETNGIISTFAGICSVDPGYDGGGASRKLAKFHTPSSLAIDHEGNLYIVDSGNQCIREVPKNSSRIIDKVGMCGSAPGLSPDGTKAESAQLNYPQSVAVDKYNNIYFSDYYNQLIRKVSPATDQITTVAGSGSAGFGGDGGRATRAEVNYPLGLAVDSAGNLYIADFFNERIRVVVANTGIIITVAGGNGKGYKRDGIPATKAGLNHPSGVEVDASGNLYIADSLDHRVLLVHGVSSLFAIARTLG